jgi:hypothetical protein
VNAERTNPNFISDIPKLSQSSRLSHRVSTSVSLPPSAPLRPPDQDEDDGFPIGAIGGLIALCIIAAIAYCCYKKRKSGSAGHGSFSEGSGSGDLSFSPE